MLWRAACSRRFEIGRVIESQLNAGDIGDLSSEVVDVSVVDSGESKFIEDWEKETKGPDGHERLGIVRTEESPNGTEEQSRVDA